MILLILMKHAKQIITKVNKKTGKYERLSICAPKGKREVGVDQNGHIIIYDDKGTIVAIKENK
jgi:hypothetical protein